MELIFFVVVWTSFLAIVGYSFNKKRLAKIEKKIEAFSEEIKVANRFVLDEISRKLTVYTQSADSINEGAYNVLMFKLQDLHAEITEIAQVYNRPKKEKKEKPAK
jgi:hypothetical protein